MSKMKPAPKGTHKTSAAEQGDRPVKPVEEAAPAPMPIKKVPYSELSPVIREALVQAHKERETRPDWPNLQAAMKDCLVRIQRNWGGFLEECDLG